MSCKFLESVVKFGKRIKFLSCMSSQISGHLKFLYTVTNLKHSLDWWHSLNNLSLMFWFSGVLWFLCKSLSILLFVKLVRNLIFFKCAYMIHIFLLSELANNPGAYASLPFKIYFFFFMYYWFYDDLKESFNYNSFLHISIISVDLKYIS